MSVDTRWDIESYRAPYESEEHWTLKREFMEAHKHRIPEVRLICLAQVFVNIELLGCKYPDPVMEQVAVMARDVGHDYKERKKTKLQRTFVKASDAAGARLKGASTSALIEAAGNQGNAAGAMNQGAGHSTAFMNAGHNNNMNTGAGNFMSSLSAGAGSYMSSMDSDAHNPMSSMNMGARNSMSSMNTGAGNFMSSMNAGPGNFTSSMNTGAGNMSSMNPGGSYPMNRGSNPPGNANTMSQGGGGNASSLLGRPPPAVTSKLASLKKPVAFVAAGVTNPLADDSSGDGGGGDTARPPNPYAPMASQNNGNNNKNSSSLLGAPPSQYSNTFKGSNANPSVFGGLSAKPNMFGGGSNASPSLSGGSTSMAPTYGGSNNNPSMPGGLKPSLYGGLINSSQAGGSNTMSGGSSAMMGGSNTGRPMLGGSSSNNNMLGGSNTMLGGSNSMMGGSNAGMSLLGSAPGVNSNTNANYSSSSSCLFPGGPPSPNTTIITAPPNKKKKSKADKSKDKPITEKFIKFIGSDNTGATPDMISKTASMTLLQKAGQKEGQGRNTGSSSSTYTSFASSGFTPSSGYSSSSSSRMGGQMTSSSSSSSRMGGQMSSFSSSSSSSFNNSGPSSSSFSSSSFKNPGQQSSSSFPTSSSSNSRAQKQSHLAHWSSVVGKNNPLLAFVLVRRENHDNNGAAAAILNTSSCFSRIPINYVYNKVGNFFECTVSINGVDVVSARSTSRKKARDQAVVEAVNELPKHCFTLKVKKALRAESVSLDQVANDLNSRSFGSQNNPLGGNSVANKMMKQMGWTGGGLGKKGEGITEPVRPSEVFGRQGLGLTETSSNVKGAVTPAFCKRVREIISDFASNPRNTNLSFSSEFSKDQRTEIHKIARLSHLKSVSHGSGKTRCVVISHKVAAQDLLLRLLQEGNNDQYQLTPPTSYEP